GHTHGGQQWPIRYLVTLQQPYVDGYRVVGDVPVFTSRGVGAWGPPVRVAASPEVPLITLRRG
ncbi:MAG: metallophosphoesterase, partial [Dermatophilaceae bacterium]